jgi:hypothetical protein
VQQQPNGSFRYKATLQDDSGASISKKEASLAKERRQKALQESSNESAADDHSPATASLFSPFFKWLARRRKR